MSNFKIIFSPEDCICSYAVRLLEESFQELQGIIRICFYCGEENTTESRYTDEYIKLASETRTNFRDSRIYGWGAEKTATWEFWVEKESELAIVLAETALEELKNKFTDYLYIEQLQETILNSDLRQSNKKMEYFFEAIQDGEKLRNVCVKKILKRNMLPPWQLLIQISSQLYERRPLNTRIFFMKEEVFSVPSVQIQLDIDGNFKDQKEIYRLSAENLRTVRKMMETISAGQGLLIERNEYLIRGIASQEECRKISDICIHFQGYLNWEVIRINNNKDTGIPGNGKSAKKDEVLLSYEDGVYQFPDSDEENNSCEQELEKTSITELQKVRIQKIIQKISKQPHGTAIVFMGHDVLEDETKRLFLLNRCHQVKPFNLLEQSPEMLMGITSIDGALMADFDGMCRAIGAILDGDAVIPGNLGRGARYNSIKNYICRLAQKKKTEKGKLFAIICSEDKDVDFVDNMTENEMPAFL